MASAGDVAANFQTSGTLTVVRVKPGQRVVKGQVLARVDSLSARQAVAEAEANLATAQGRLQQTLNPLNAQEKAQLTVSDEQAAESVRTATVALSDTNAQAAHDLAQAQGAVTQAKQQLASDKAQRTSDVNAKATQAVLDQDAAKISTDQTALQSATANVSTTKLKNTQSVHSAQNQLAQAKLQQQSNAAANAVKTAAPKPGDLASAKAAVVQAQIQLAQARMALRETTLRAPVSGVVASVDGSVGDTVSASGNGSSSANSSSDAAASDSSSSSSLELHHDHGAEQAAGRRGLQRGRRRLDQGRPACDRDDQRSAGSHAGGQGHRHRLDGDDRLQRRHLQRDVRAARARIPSSSPA